MTTSVQRRRGSTIQHSTFTGLEGEITIDTTKDTAVIHDGSTTGGFPLAKESLSNANPTPLAAIAGSATADNDLFLVYDASEAVLKKITRAELNNAIEADALANVTITGGSINGTSIGNTTAGVGYFTTLESSSTTILNGTTIPATKILVVTTDIGVSVQAYDADLTTLGAGGSAARSFLGLAIGTDVQAYDADLTTLGSGGNDARTFLGLGTGDSPTFTTQTLSGNLTFTGAGNRIRGDFSAGTVANRLAFQNSVTNGVTAIPILPNGTATTARHDYYNSSDPANSGFGRIEISTTAFGLQAGLTGTGSFLPIVFNTSNTERLRIDTSGNVGIGTNAPKTKFQVTGKTAYGNVFIVNDDYAEGTAGSGIAISTGASSGNTYTSIDAFQAGYASANNLILNITGGYVGIGTSSPSTKFDLIGGTGSVAAPSYLNQTAFAIRNNFHTRMALVNPSNTYASEISRYNASAAYPTQTFSMNGDAGFVFLSGAGTAATTEHMRLTSAGYLGIGTNNPTQKLTISGGDAAISIGNGYGSLRASDGAYVGMLSMLAATNTTVLKGGYGSASATSTAISLRNVGDTELMILQAGGNVGIGASSITAIYGTTLQIGDSSTSSTLSLTGSGAGSIGDVYLAGTSDSALLYARTSTPLVFGTNDIERMRILSNGWVGIGLTNPSMALDVSGSIRASQSITIGNGVGSNYEAGSIFADSNWGMIIRSKTASPAGGAAFAFMQSGGSESMRIDTSGNLALGTTTASYKLEVSGTGRFNDGGAGGGTVIFGNNLNGGLAKISAPYNNPIFTIANNTANPIAFNTSGTTERMRIDASGNVQIGTTSGASKLTVYGGALGSTAGDVKYLQSMWVNSANSDAFEVLYSRAATDNGWTTANLVLRRNVDGSAAQQSIVFAGDDSLRLFTAGSERMRINSAGAIGFGTTTPQSYVDVQCGATSAPTYKGFVRISGGSLTANGGLEFLNTTYASGYGWRMQSPDEGGGSAPLVFQTRSNTAAWSEAIRFDAAGNVGIGTTVTSTYGAKVTISSAGSLQSTLMMLNPGIGSAQIGISAASPNLKIYNTYATGTLAGGAGIDIDNAGNVGIGLINPAVKLNVAAANDTPVIIQTTNANNYLQLSNSTNNAYIGAIGSNLNFTVNGSERIRIISSGEFCIGTTTVVGERGISVSPNSSAGAAAMYWNRAATTGTSYIQDYRNGGATVGYIAYSNTVVSYITSSDYRLKENIAPMKGALDTISKLKPVTYNWKTDGSKGQGFIAHELKEVIPDAANGEKDAVDESGNIIPQGIDPSKIVATLVAAMQEQQVLIEQLTTRLNALEGK